LAYPQSVLSLPLYVLPLSVLAAMLQQNYSLSGAFRPLSKLIICFVMLRGRHRGLPVAIDRAVMLPLEFKMLEKDQEATSAATTNGDAKLNDFELKERLGNISSRLSPKSGFANMAQRMSGKTHQGRLSHETTQRLNAVTDV
jgi:Cation transport protein